MLKFEKNAQKPVLSSKQNAPKPWSILKKMLKSHDSMLKLENRSLEPSSILGNKTQNELSSSFQLKEQTKLTFKLNQLSNQSSNLLKVGAWLSYTPNFSKLR